MSEDLRRECGVGDEGEKFHLAATQLVKKHQTHFDGFDDKIISLYARGMTTREIQGHLQELYGVEVSPDLVSRATDAVLEEVKAWQNRPLDPVWPIVYLDALVVKVRDQGIVLNKANHPIPGFPQGCPQGHLHYERDRIAELPATKNHQDPRAFPD